MSGWLTLSTELRLACLLLLGVAIGRIVNWATQRLRLAAWPGVAVVPPYVRGSTPWRHLPIVGWIVAPVEWPDGSRQWLRPLVVETLCAVGVAGLYWWEIDRLALLTPVVPPAGPMSDALRTSLLPMYGAHLLLVFLMLVASLIDLDERIIPDQITVPGTLAGLALPSLEPRVLLPTQISLASADTLPTVERLHLASPRSWPEMLGAAPHWGALLLGVACFLGWCFALLPRRWYGRRGLLSGVRFFLARIRRERVSRSIGVMALLGVLGIAAVWTWLPSHWPALLSALVGMAVGGGLVWAVRLIGAFALRREAMGFGDVTLMAMIGTLLGWQNCLIIFFLAPITALVLGLLQWIAQRDSEIPYGPFLCLATVLVLVQWRDLWSAARQYYVLGWLIPMVVVVCLALMAVLLVLLQAVRHWLFGEEALDSRG